jgi:muramidase (phage lysozyme)
MIKNLPDILWYGSEGKVIEPDIPSKYGAELVIHSDWVKDHPLKVEYPEEIADKVKLRYRSEFNGETWIMPQLADDPGVGAVVEHGNDLEEVIEKCKETAAKIQGHQVENFSRSFPVALEKIKKLKSLGIDF